MENKEKELFGITPPPTEEKKTEEKPVDNRYKVYGENIYVADKEIIEYYQMSAKLLCFANLLVGRFDDKGNYIIAKEIKRDLVAMDKEISEDGATFFKATNLYMKKNFYYYISLSKTAEGKGKASLYLYEYVGDYLEKDFISSHIADFVDELDSSFKDKVRHSFNLVDVDVPNDDRITPSLAVLMQKMLDEQLRSVDIIEMACQVYVIRSIKNLEKSAQGRRIVEKFKEELAKISKGKQLSFMKQKAILDRIVNSFGGYEVLDIDQKTQQELMQELTKTFNETVARKAIVEAVVPEKKEEKKTGTKSSAKKPAAKKAAGGGGAKKAAGKKAAKSDDKKDKKGGGVAVNDLKGGADKKKTEKESAIDKIFKKLVTTQDVLAQRLKDTKNKKDEEELEVSSKPPKNPGDEEGLDVKSKKKPEQADEVDPNLKKPPVEEEDFNEEDFDISHREAGSVEILAGQADKNGKEDEEENLNFKNLGLSEEEIESFKNMSDEEKKVFLEQRAEAIKVANMTDEERKAYFRKKIEDEERKRREEEERKRAEEARRKKEDERQQGDDDDYANSNT